MRDQTDSRTLPLPLGIPGIEVIEFFGPMPLAVFHGDGRAMVGRCSPRGPGRASGMSGSGIAGVTVSSLRVCGLRMLLVVSLPNWLSRPLIARFQREHPAVDLAASSQDEHTMQSILEILVINTKSGKSKKTGNDYSIPEAQCVLRNDDQSVAAVGVLVIPKHLEEQAKPGLYTGSFALERLHLQQEKSLHALAETQSTNRHALWHTRRTDRAAD